jgi:hypothetical protein
MAKRGRATVALVTEQFWPQGDFVATAAGMPDLPRQLIPHPVAGTGGEAMAELADRIADRLIATLRAEPVAA